MYAFSGNDQGACGAFFILMSQCVKVYLRIVVRDLSCVVCIVLEWLITDKRNGDVDGITRPRQEPFDQ